MTSRHRSVYEFNSAIVRAPSRTVVDGLAAKPQPEPVSYAAVLQEHRAYVSALEAAGLTVHKLPPLEAYPDSVFVEDPALVFEQAAVLLRPGAETRLGEAGELLPVLEKLFPRVLSLPENGYADGGDVLVTPSAVLIGLSARTTSDGADALAGLLADLGLNPQIVETPAGVLHFKTDCSLLDDQTVLVTERLADAALFVGYEMVVVPPGEEGAANALRVNDVVLVGEQFPKSARQIADSGFTVVPLPTREIAKIDAGLSCMSLRWRC